MSMTPLLFQFLAHVAPPPMSAAVLGALPFLPMGKGALILIAGGGVVMAFSLVWSLFSRRADPASIAAHAPRRRPRIMPRRTVAPANHAPWLVSHSQALPPVERWMTSVMSNVARQGLGRPRLVSAEPGHQVLFMVGCRSCSDRRPDATGCDRERAVLEEELRAFAPTGRVVETRCDETRTQGGCTFDLWTGGLP